MRTITPALLGAMAASNVQPFYMVAIQFTSAIVYLWTGIGTITWNGHDWLGVGSFGGVSAITSTSQITAENITLSLSSIQTDFVEAAINECQQNYSVDVWLGFLADDGAIIVDPVRAFNGHLDVPTLQDDGTTCTISITAENPLVDLQRPSNYRYTDADQQIDFPGDKGFSFVTFAQQWNGVWGSPGATGNPTPPSGPTSPIGSGGGAGGSGGGTGGSGPTRGPVGF